MDYQTAISAACRTLTARGSLTLTTGYTSVSYTHLRAH